MDGTSRIDELEKKFIENPRRYFAPLANEYRKAGNPHQAIAICRAHLGQLPGHMSGQIVYGQSLFEGGEFDEARTVFENALAMDRENLIALKHLGDLALRNGETGTARQFYSKLLEIDPQDAKVIAIVNEIDAAAEAQPSAEEHAVVDQENAGQVRESESAPVPETAPAEALHHVEEDALIAEELGFPVPPPQAFVTETMAELYLAQGFRDRAIDVYRQLAALRPDDERLRSRLMELEAPQTEPVEHEAPEAVVESTADEPLIEARREDAPSVESPDAPSDSDGAPSIEAPTPPAQVEAPSEESDDGDSMSIDSPPAEFPDAASDSVEAPAPDEPRAEPDGIAAQLTVREFFATLGRRRPTSRSNGNGSNGAAVDPSRDVFGGGAASESDSRAAAVLAGAFGAPVRTQSTTPTAAVPGRESEEDVARFRAWLDGLTGQ